MSQKTAKYTVDTTFPIGKVIDALKETYRVHPMADVTGSDPYKVLISCIMSLRTRDDMTFPIAKKLFRTVDTPQKMVKLTVPQIEKAIYPVGFYKTKAKNILAMSQRILDEFNGIVPDDIDTLLTFNGVGRKTANLVVAMGYQKPGICVDTHVHRICNRLGYIVTKTPEATEWALRDNLPEKYWPIVNRVLVCHGQTLCKPIGPICNECPVEKQCRKINVKPRKVADAAAPKDPTSQRELAKKLAKKPRAVFKGY